MADFRNTQTSIDVLSVETASIRASQAGIDVLSTETANLVVTQIRINVLAPSDFSVCDPSEGTITLTGYVPSISQNPSTNNTPTTGSITYTGYQGTVVQGRDWEAEPVTGLVTYTGYESAIGYAQAITPETGLIVLTGGIPKINPYLAPYYFFLGR